MDARHLLAAASAAAAFLTLTLSVQAAQVATPNFVVEAPTPAIAQQVADAAERYRHDLAIHWLGEPLPKNWRKPCPIRVTVGEQLGAGGETSFLFDRGHVFGWDMRIQGSLERVLDSVLPHEVTHTIFASYFRQPLPRWADEGACTTVEHDVERGNHRRMLVEFLHTGRGIAFSQMFAMTEYPRDVLPLYSQGHSLVTYLLQQGGPRKFVTFMESGLAEERWSEAVREHYGYPSLAALQDSWLDWVKEGSPEGAASEPEQLLADAGGAETEGGIVYRGQNPEGEDDAVTARSRPRPGPVAGEDDDSVYEPTKRRRQGQAGRASPAEESSPTDPRGDAGRDRNPPDERSTSSVRADDTRSSDSSPAQPAGAPPRRVILEWRRPTDPEDRTDANYRPPLDDASERGVARWR